MERLAERILFLKGEVEMTPSGSVEKIHCVKEMLKKAAEMENRMLEGVTEEERETFFRVIDKIKDNLK